MRQSKNLIDLIIFNAKIPLGNKIFNGGIAINEGKIYTIGKLRNLPKAIERINAKNGLVLPGLIDIHTHIRDLKLGYKEDFYSGTCAALAGGFTTIMDMPNTLPPTNSLQNLREKIDVARKKIVANVGFYTCFPKDLGKMKGLAERSIGFKIFLHLPHTELNVEDNLLLDAFRKAKEVGRLVAVHAEDKALIESIETKLKNEGKISVEAYLEAHPPEAEVEAVKKVISLVKMTGARTHFCHISTKEALSLIVKSKNDDLPITCEVTPHHLLLSNDGKNKPKDVAIIDPPIRSDAERRAVWRSLIKGEVDVVASDHAPHTLIEKRTSNVWCIPPGAPGLETTLPLLLTMVKGRRLSLNQLLELLARKPAEIFHLKSKGAIKEGFDADLIIIEYKKDYINPLKFHSKAKYSPFDGWEIVGKPVKTFVGGKLAMDDGEIIAKPGSGKIISL